jgi:hypothetical protein
MKEYIPKESTLVIQYEPFILCEKSTFDGMNEINKKRRVMASDKCVLLKDQTVITTEGIYEQVKACEIRRGVQRDILKGKVGSKWL